MRFPFLARSPREFSIEPLTRKASQALAALHREDFVRPWTDGEFEQLLSQETVFGFAGLLMMSVFRDGSSPSAIDPDAVVLTLTAGIKPEASLTFGGETAEVVTAAYCWDQPNGAQACVDGTCGDCRTDADCCAPLICNAGRCEPLLF